MGLTDHTHFSLSRPLSSSSCFSSQDLRPCLCSSRRALGPVAALGQDLLLNTSLRTPGIPTGVSFDVWERGKARLFNVWSFRGESSLSPLLAAALSASLVRGLSVGRLRVQAKWQPPLSHHSYAVWTTLLFACKQEIIGNQKLTDREKEDHDCLKRKLL